MIRRIFHAAPVWFGLMTLVLLVLAGGVAMSGKPNQPVAVMAMGGGEQEGHLLAEFIPHMNNHNDPDGPVYAGEFADEQPPDDGKLLVVSYNLRYGEAIAETIQAYRQTNPLPAADIILLQEMDEDGVQAIARELGLNYVYYPASVAEDGDNFGNAILSRWSISDPAKLILPGLHPLTGQQRTATRAVVRVDEMNVLVYSTHIEVATAPPALREAQFAAILDDIPEDANHVIVGGDFNTVTGWGVEALAEQFAAKRFDHPSADLGPTFTRFGVRPSATDHIFTRGFTPLEAGVLSDIDASDHYPVWAWFSRQ